MGLGFVTAGSMGFVTAGSMGFVTAGSMGFVTAGSRMVAVGELGLGTMTLTARPTKTRRGEPLGPPPLTSAILELTC
jgi:hypothetical protein